MKPLASSCCQLVCIQESKLQSVDPFLAAYLGGQRLKSSAQRPYDGTKGSILLLWDDSAVMVTNVHIGVYFLSATVAINNYDGDKSLS